MANIINFPSGKVGVGTENPQQTLDIAGTLRLSGSTGTGTTLMARNASGDVSAVTIGVGLNLSNNSLTATGGGTGTVSGSGTATQVAFWGGTTGSTSTALSGSSNLYWDGVNNRLGIGTSTPASTLDIAGTLRIGSTNVFSFASNTITTPTNTNTFIAVGGNRFLHITNSTATQNIINFDGTSRNVGIGIGLAVAGSARLHVVGSGITATGWTAQFHNSGGTSNSLMIRDDGNVAIGNNSPNARLQVHGADTSDSNWTAQFHNVNGNNNSLMIRNDGRVSFGTANPSKPFHVVGESYFASALQLEGGLKDNRDNVFLSQSLNSVASNRDIILGNGTYARIRLHSKEVSIGASFPTTSYLFYVDGGTGTGITDRQGIYMRPTQPAAGGNTNGGDVIIELPNGTGTGRKGTVLIGASATTINSALLELVSTDRGFLPPRMTSVERDAIATPATGLQIYNTTLNVMQHYNGTTWVSEAGGSGGTGTLTGSGTATQVAFWGGTTGSTSTALSGSSNLYWDGINNRLGIGTSTPAARLDVGNGVIGITGSIGFTNNSRMITFNDANNGMLYTGFGGHRFSVFNQTTYQNALVITGNSPTPNVGIAVEAPVARLQVQGSDTSDTGWTAQFHNSLGNSNSLMIRNDGNVGVGTSGTTARFVVRASGSSTGSTAMLIQNSGGTTLFRVREDGNVGIGTAEPTNRLYVDGSTYVGSLTVLGSINSIGGNIFLANTRTIQFGSNTSIIGQDGNSGFIRYTVNNNEIFRATTTSIGIGTTTPAQTLHVAGTMRLTGSTGTGTTLMARNVDGDVSAVTVGSGLNLSNNTLTATGGGSGTVSGSGTATQVAFWDNTTSLAGNSNLYWDNVNSRLGVGITTPTSNLDVVGSVEFQNPSTAFDGPTLGTELLTTGTGTNWTGTSFATGYLHATGSTVALTSVFTPVATSYYVVVVTVSGVTAGNINFTFGGNNGTAISTNTTQTNYWIATTTGALIITPSNDFNGTVIASVRLITPSTAVYIGRTNNGTLAYEERYNGNNIIQGINAGRSNISGNSNIFQGVEAGRFNTTGNNNIFQGPNAGYSNTTGNFNIFQGVSAGFSNTTGNYNIFQGLNAGYSNTTGNFNIFQGVSAGFSNTTADGNIFQGFETGFSNISGNNNIFQGLFSGRSNTVGTFNLFQGRDAGRLNVSGSNNIFQGVFAAYDNTTGSNNVIKGVSAGRSNTTGSNNVMIGHEAGRYVSAGLTGNTLISNSILLGFDARVLSSGQTNQVVIGYEGRGLGSNTTVIGNTSTTQTHLHGNLTLGSTSSPAARMVVVGSGSSDTGWTAQFHNVLGNSNSLMIRDDGNVGIGTSSPTATFTLRGNALTTNTLLTQNSAGVQGFTINSDGRVAIGIPASDVGFRIQAALTGSFPYSYNNEGTMQSGVNEAIYNGVFMRLAAGITVSSATGYYAGLATPPVGSTLINAYGFVSENMSANATRAYAFEGRNSAGTNKFNLYMAGSAVNYLAGSLGIGTDAPAQTLHVAGTMRLTGSTGTGTTLMARNANGDVSAVTLGTGVVLSNNVISVALSPKAETPNGLVNGSNITYTLASTPIANQSVMVFLNGVAQYNGIDYTVSGTTITFGTAPANGSSIFAYYMA